MIWIKSLILFLFINILNILGLLFLLIGIYAYKNESEPPALIISFFEISLLTLIGEIACIKKIINIYKARAK